MRKIDYSFLAGGVVLIAGFMWYTIQTKEVKIILLLVTICYCLASVVRIYMVWRSKKRREIMVDLSIAYWMLLDMYEYITDSKNQNDELLKLVFITQVREFNCMASDISSSRYPKEMKNLADEMRMQLTKLVVSLRERQKSPDTIERS